MREAATEAVSQPRRQHHDVVGSRCERHDRAENDKGDEKRLRHVPSSNLRQELRPLRQQHDRGAAAMAKRISVISTGESSSSANLLATNPRPRMTATRTARKTSKDF